MGPSAPHPGCLHCTPVPDRSWSEMMPPGAQTAWETPPCTPRCRRVPSVSPPARRASKGPLLSGLERNCWRRVRSALEADPEAARLPLMEPRVEWPLCAAIRLGCSEDIVQLLVQNGARVEVTNEQGQSPLQCLSSGLANEVLGALPADFAPGTDDWAERVRESAAQGELRVAMALMSAGADPEARHGDRGGEQCSSLELAQRAGKDHLVRLYAQNPARDLSGQGPYRVP
ncbi:unnamed protein product [Prorocentrum cordatum]|uniref:Uncharacterized protein n=1 Tax=Prorocentrum cordatum TaxID=2364126 RepID=A0ABN9UXK9_9DINO|nr:unnamed protein product [Polarella glacialis]